MEIKKGTLGILAKDITSGASVELSSTEDTGGKNVLRIVDASPFAYDDTTETLSVRPKKALPAMVTLSETVNVAASGTKTFTLTPAANEIWRIRQISLDVPVPSGGGSGSHVIQGMYLVTNSTLNEVFTISNAFGAKIVIRGNNPLTKNNSYPTTDGDFADQIRNIVISAANPFIILYTNLTDVAQTGTIGLKILYEIEYVL